MTSLNGIWSNVFAQRAEVLMKVYDDRVVLAKDVESFFNRTLVIIENNIKIISAADNAAQDVISKEPQSPCIANLKMMLDLTIEGAGFSISVCVSDIDGVARAAYRTAATFIDLRERDFITEPTILTNAFIGRNIFTQDRAIINRSQNQLNARTTTFAENLAEILLKLSEASKVYEDQIAILNSCFNSLDAQIAAEIGRIVKFLPAVCQRFVKAEIK